MAGVVIIAKSLASTALRVIRSWVEFRNDCALAIRIMVEFGVISSVRWDFRLPRRLRVTRPQDKDRASKEIAETELVDALRVGADCRATVTFQNAKTSWEVTRLVIHIKKMLVFAIGIGI